MLDPGVYTVVVKSFESKFENDKEYLAMVYETKEGPKQKDTNFPDAEGREIFDRVYLTNEAAWRLKQLLVATGLLARDDKDSEMAKGDINLDQLMSGGAFRIRLTTRLYKDQGGNQKEARNVEFLF